MTKKLLTQALQIAHKEHTTHPEWRHFMHWTFVIADGKIVEWATNKKGQPERHFGYHSNAKVHSELFAYRKARGLLKERFEIVNVRINRQGELKIAAPCGVCREWLTAVGCERAWFTLTEGGWGRWR